MAALFGGLITTINPAEQCTLFSQVFDGSPVGMGILSAAGNTYIDANETLAALLGYSRDELRGLPTDDVGVAIDLDAQLLLETLREYREIGGIPITVTNRDGHDHTCVLSSQLVEIDGEEYIFFLFHEYTPEEKPRTALAQFETRFKLFYQGFPLPLLVIDDESARIADVNPAAIDLYGYDRDEFLGLSWDSLVSEGDRPGLAAQPAAALSGIMCHRLRDGRLIDANVSSFSFRLDDRPATLSIVEDITEQQAVRAALEASEERQRIIADMTADAIRDRDLITGKVVWNLGLRDLFGYDTHDPAGRSWWSERIHPDDRAAVLATLDAALRSDVGDWMGEYRFRRADGAYANVLDNTHIMRDAGGRPTRLIGSMVDITEQLKLADVAAKAALEERQRLAHTLHDSVSQSLYSISLLAEASRRLALAGEQQGVTDYVARLGELTIQTLRQMRLLLYDLRPGVLDQEGLSGALRHRLEAVEHRAGIRARLIDHSLGPVSPALQREIFWIAQEALNNSLTHASATAVNVTLSSTNDEIVLEVSDNGQGFDPNTTAEDGGLVAIDHRVSELGGTLAVNSGADRGTMLIVRVPTAPMPG
ncbi:MAG TPA: PAS domain S-box protein [Promineifilum sp.]|nr:PAS domain S-box protein [Promineifilum sp.]HRO90443.1 PAS domain S-box protein [Promineifilum sp.]HRQ13974.1 PAS domain S-box protein [Promineifilum sp.]